MTSTSTRLPDRALLRVSGPNTRDFLQGLLTNDVHALRPDAPLWAGLLSPQGKVLFDMMLWDPGDGSDAVLVDVEASRSEALAKRLTMYRLRRPIVIEAVDAGVHWSRSGDSGCADPRLAMLGRRWIGSDRGETAADAWRGHRLSLGVTEGVAELGDGVTLWLECNARELNGVSFDKGCYVGQENTARMHHRAKVNRRLIVAPIGPPTERTRTSYPDLGLMVEHRRVEAIGDALMPTWLAAALS